MTNEELIKMSGELILKAIEVQEPYQYEDEEVFEKCRDEFLTLFKDRHFAMWAIKAKESQLTSNLIDPLASLFDASKEFIKFSKYSDDKAELLFIIMLWTCKECVSDEF